MRIFLLPGDSVRRDGPVRIACRLPHPDASHVLAKPVGPWAARCPLCQFPGPVALAGRGQRDSADGRAYECDASTLCCRRPVGVLRAEPDTLFGVAEDRAVLAGRARVY